MTISSRRDSSRALVALLAAAALSSATAVLSGEVVVLRDGRKLTGDCRVTGKEVSVARGRTTSYVPRALVERIELTAAEEQEFSRLRDAGSLRGAAGSYTLGKWLDDHLQYEQADAYYAKAIEADPNHAASRAALGYSRSGKAWVADPSKQLARAMLGFGQAAADACVRIAKDFAAKGNAKSAELALRRALVANPENAEGLQLIQPYLAGYKPKNAYRKPIEGRTVGVSAHNHRTHAQSYNAIDFGKVDDAGRTSTGDGTRLEDYVVYGAPVVAAAAGEVIAVIDGNPDMPVGQPGDFLKANAVALKHAGGEFTLYAHLKAGTITVHVGQSVKAGDVLGKVGNSGGTSAPHLHFSLYDFDGISLPITFPDNPPPTNPGP